MNKTELIEAVALEAGVSRTEAKRVLDKMIGVVSRELLSGEKIVISGFGTLSVVRQAGRTGRDPRNGHPIPISAKNVVKFRPGQELSELVK
ncbi:MAG: HU family DNA-binding protein [Tidjanibacter sp.]|nr:HU family DNA-binding protein [Tidjanibacter sp.]